MLGGPRGGHPPGGNSAALAAEVAAARGRAVGAADLPAFAAALALALVVCLVLALKGLAEHALGLVEVGLGGFSGRGCRRLCWLGGSLLRGLALGRGGLRRGGLRRCLRGVLL